MTFTTISLLGVMTTLLPGGEPSSFPQSRTQIGNPVSEMSKSIFIVFQDKKNTYWFGSDGQGVYRYDGKTLVRFTTKDGLPNDRIREFQEDKAGNLYITTLRGISKFDGKVFSTLVPKEVASPTEGWRLNPEDLWFKGNSEEHGPFRYDGKTLYHLKFPKHHLEDEAFARVPNPPASFYGLYTIYRDRRGNLWFGTVTLGAGRYDGKSFGWLFEDHLTNPPSGGSFGIRSILEDKRGKFWFSNTQFRFNVQPKVAQKDGKALIDYKRESGLGRISSKSGDGYLYYLSIAEDDKGDVWMATYRDGVWRYNGKKLTHYPVNDGNKEITVFTVYKDRRGDMWLGTHEAGAYKFNGKEFIKFLPKVS
jgi:ligand-binding sensor domain-containing protein